MASSDSQIDKPQRGRPKRAELPDVNIYTGAQSINTERASPCDWSLPAHPISIRKAQSRKKIPYTLAHLANFPKNMSAMFYEYVILLL